MTRYYQVVMIHEQDGSIGFEIDPFGLFHDFETFYRDISLIG